jgi:hypothetical protein
VLLDSLNARNGQSLRELCAGLSMARQSVSKHLAGARSGQPGSGTGAEPAAVPRKGLSNMKVNIAEPQQIYEGI